MVPDKTGKEKLQLGLHELDGDTWKLCLDEAGTSVSAAEFSGKARSGRVLVTLKKVDDEKSHEIGKEHRWRRWSVTRDS